jgi:hypothetical protein
MFLAHRPKRPVPVRHGARPGHPLRGDGVRGPTLYTIIGVILLIIVIILLLRVI